MATLKNNGKKFESKTTAILTELTAKQKGLVHRFVDKTQAMSGFVPASPGDYLLLVPGKAILVECKSTVTKATLMTLAHKNKVQIASHRKFHRAGHYSIYLYFDMKNDTIECHDGKKVVLKVNEPLFTCQSKDFLDNLRNVIGTIE